MSIYEYLALMKVLRRNTNYCLCCGGCLWTGKAFSLTGNLLTLCPVQGGELGLLAGDLKAPDSTYWKGFQSDWLSLCPAQGTGLVQLAGDLKVPGSYPG